VGTVEWGYLRRVTPISDHFGWDRGQPVDRYYIEKFLQEHRHDIHGRVLEIHDSQYTNQFGGSQVSHPEVLNLTPGGSQINIVADLTAADHVPSERFDCIILTQTLMLIYDFKAALRTCHRILKPGGVLLTTFPGICRICHPDPPEDWEDCWRFTKSGAQKFFAEVFPPAQVKVQAHGNVLSAIAFLHGLAVEELRPEELDYDDPAIELLITVRAQKPPAS